jgi:hypothetical protein
VASNASRTTSRSSHTRATPWREPARPPQLTHAPDEAERVDQPEPTSSVPSGHSFADVSIFPAPQLTSDATLVMQRAAASDVPVTTSWIVDDSATVAKGQMRRQDFLDALRERVHASANLALAPIGRGSDGCPYIVRLLARVGRMPAAALERLARAHASGAATSANDYLAAVDARIERGVAEWIVTGELPADVPADADLSAGGDAGEDAPPALAFARAATGTAQQMAAPIGDQRALQSFLGSGAPLPTDARASLEEGFGEDLGAVRVHHDSRAGALAEHVAAHAVTVGNDVAFAAGAYQPASATGMALLAHEVAHTLQQRGGEGRIQGFGDASHEDEADEGARVALARAYGDKKERPRWSTGGLQLQRCGTKGTSAEDGGPTQTQKPPPPKQAPKDPERVALETVKELTVSDPAGLSGNVSAESQEATFRSNAKSSFGIAQTRLAKRITQIDAIVAPLAGKSKPTKADTDKLAVLARMKSRWTDTILTKASFDPANGPVSAADATALNGKIADDKTDAASVGNSGLTDWVDKLGASVTDYLSRLASADAMKGKIAEEAVEFQRFNDLFLDKDVKAALTSTAADFRPADLKAMLAKETGDFTNTAIAGLGGKTKGIVSNKANTLGPSFIGVAQMDTGAKTDALKQATKLSITITDTKSDDARNDPARAIKLAACYVAFIAEYLRTNLPATVPTGSALKPFVLAAYNGGIGAVRTAATTHGKSPYTWADITANSAAMGAWKASKQTEVKDYVARIIATAP